MKEKNYFISKSCQYIKKHTRLIFRLPSTENKGFGSGFEAKNRQSYDVKKNKRLPVWNRGQTVNGVIFQNFSGSKKLVKHSVFWMQILSETGIGYETFWTGRIRKNYSRFDTFESKIFTI